ncbi:FAD-dependent monooxygenase [Nonomuraea sp. SBT364]|uniref:FAD-dependent monooxygenase n=1 Tax=Nonomuraea sp. SBT364 TaxID=1580530 RepID=UPI00066C569A|nr:FAD-dependent monooxygenase [Nonomuraea sp. SBT364]
MDILVSGASVAGPALAFWLTRHGHRVTVVERAPALREGGYAVDFRGEAHLTVLRRMGLLDAVERERTRMGATWNVNEAGKKLTAMPEDLFAGDVEILRGDLARILYDATRDDAEYVFGDSITSISADAEVTFEAGAPRRFDLVIGADGLHSNVRALTFGPERQFVRHLGLYCAVFTLDNYLGLDHSGLAYNVPGRTVGVYSARDNTEAKAMFWFASPPLDHDRRDVAAQRRLLAEAYAGVGWEAPRLLAVMDRAPDFFFDSAAQVRLESWSRGRVALLGDAAWCPSPLSGMGTGLALVGAYVLAGEIAAAGADHRTAFARYEQVMRGYATACQKSGEGVSKFMVPDSRLMAWFVNQSYKLMPYMPWKKAIARSVRKTAEAVSLPDYGLTRPAGPAPRRRPSDRAS